MGDKERATNATQAEARATHSSHVTVESHLHTERYPAVRACDVEFVVLSSELYAQTSESASRRGVLDAGRRSGDEATVGIEATRACKLGVGGDRVCAATAGLAELGRGTEGRCLAIGHRITKHLGVLGRLYPQHAAHTQHTR